MSASLFVPTFVYSDHQRFPATGANGVINGEDTVVSSGSVSTGENEVSKNNTSEVLADVYSSDEDEGDPFSDPSPVSEGQPLISPTEQSLSSSSDEEQSRKATPSVGDGGRGRFKSTTVKPHLYFEEPANKSDAIEEDETLVNNQKTWGPSDNPPILPYLRRRSFSCPTSPTEKYPGIRQACQRPSLADKIQISSKVDTTAFTHDVYGMQ